MNEQTKHKISIAMRGRKKLATTRHKISQALKGRAKSQEHKDSIKNGMIEWHKRNKNRK